MARSKEFRRRAPLAGAPNPTKQLILERVCQLSRPRLGLLNDRAHLSTLPPGHILSFGSPHVRPLHKWIPPVAAALSSRGVEQGTYTRVTQGSVLDYNDILNLLEKKVPTNIIISYLQSTRKAYNLSYSQLQGLKDAGATPQLLNYLTETKVFMV